MVAGRERHAGPTTARLRTTAFRDRVHPGGVMCAHQRGGHPGDGGSAVSWKEPVMAEATTSTSRWQAFWTA
jgi:hypothetical protein